MDVLIDLAAVKGVHVPDISTIVSSKMEILNYIILIFGVKGECCLTETISQISVCDI